MRSISMITVIVLSFSSSAMAAEGWKLRTLFASETNAPEAGTVEASTTFDVPAANAAPVQVEAAPAPAAPGYGYGPSGCGCGKGNGGYFNFSWYGGCCEQQNSCCAGIWDNYCSQRKSWCNQGCRQPRCCQPAPVCAPACNNGCNSCGYRGAWMNPGHFGHHARSMMNFNVFGYGSNGCSTCGEGAEVYGKPAIEGSEVEGAPAPATQPAPMPEPAPAPKLEPTPAKPMAREAARGFYFPSLRMMPTSFGL